MIHFAWIEEPIFTLINDGWYRTHECTKSGSVIYSDVNGDRLEIKFDKGWATDFTSSPLWARSFLAQSGPHLPAALIHDWLLDKGFDRDFSRKLMSLQLKELPNVKPFIRRRMVSSVWFYDKFLEKS